MAKTYITSGTGASQTLDAIQNEKVPVYNTRADAEADLANIEEGGIVATKDTGATEKVVDVVQDGNMNPVTSNAVYDEMVLRLSRKGYRCSSNFSSVSWVNVTNIGVLNEGNYVVVWSQGTNIGAISIQTTGVSFLSSNVNQRLGFITIPEGGSVNQVNIALYPNSAGNGSIDVLIIKLDSLI